MWTEFLARYTFNTVRFLIQSLTIIIAVQFLTRYTNRKYSIQIL